MTFDIEAWARSPAGRRFQFYDPYLTYSNQDHDYFVDPKGKPGIRNLIVSHGK